MPMTADETRRRLGVAQIEALFGSVPVGVGAAAVASVILAAAKSDEVGRAGVYGTGPYPSMSHFSALAPASSRTRFSSAPNVRASPS